MRFKLASVSIELNLVPNFDLSLFDSTWSNSTSTGNIVCTFDRHHEGFIDGSFRDWDDLVHSVKKSFNRLFSNFWFKVLNCRNCRASDKYCFFRVIFVFFKQLSKLLFDQIDHLCVFYHVHLVEENYNLVDSDLST